MELLEQLGVALGLASLAGLNLYLTVLATGAAVHFNLLQLGERFVGLEAIGHPAVLAVAGALFLVEFFADKIPWVDSLWDSLHTVIRPVGGILIGLPALGQVEPSLQIVGALLAGGVAATTHATKASTRLVINTSPEPVSNTVASVAEDTLVLAGVGLIAFNPILALVMVAIFIGIAIYFLPRTIRMIRRTKNKVTGWLGTRPSRDNADSILRSEDKAGVAETS